MEAIWLFNRLWETVFNVTILEEYITKYPNFRFIQLLWLLDIVNNDDRFYEESEETLEIVLKKLNNSSK